MAGSALSVQTILDKVSRLSDGFDIGTRKRQATRWIGFLETGLFYASFVLGKYELAGGWLAFKVASKWPAWQHIAQPPPAVDTMDGFRTRNHWASVTLQRWLLGVLLNGAWAAVGVAAARAIGALLARCPCF